VLAGEDGVVKLRVGDVELTQFKAYSINSHYLTPTDAFHLVIGDEYITDEMLDTVLVNGRKCALFIDDAPQCSGYIAVVDTTGDRMTGNNIVINGFDAFSPVVRSEIDPRRRYPEKLTLDHLLRDVLAPFGFTKFDIDNGDNRSVAANRALHQPKRAAKPSKRPRKPAPKALKQYPLQKSRPHHGETAFQFLGRIMQREGLWLRPNVQGDGVIASTPDYDQAPCGELRRQRGGQRNNIIRGGIVRDSTDQPSHIIATGKVPGREIEHKRMMTVIDNPLTGIQSIVGGTPDRLAGKTQPNTSLNAARESGTFSSAMIQSHQEEYKWTTKIPAQPIDIVNPYASLVATPKYIRDDESHTIEQLERFAKRQMSLHLRHAFVANYTIEGHRLETGVIPQVDTVIHVIDDISRFNGPLWVVGRTFTKSRQEGSRVELELLPLGVLTF
jgi:prophage tail gpP-like protein